MEMKSPPPCPPTVTVRRNPPRRARATPSSVIPLREPLSSPSLSRDIFATKITQNPNNDGDSSKTDPSTLNLPENLKVFLRIRPPIIQKTSRTVAEPKNAWPKNPKLKSNARPKTKTKTKESSEIFVQANDDLHSVTVLTPQPLQEMKRIKSEVYEGFSHVFSAESSQNDVYEEMVKPLVEDFLKGKSGMMAAMGPSGSGKTHTVFGCVRQPGMVPLALRRIFSEDESNTTQLSRVVYLSMFEISSERGKGEKMIDLLHDGVDVSLQHSVMKGFREDIVSDAQQAESLIARGMLKRATAMTNSNSQSSRSQCIINIRCGSKQACEEVDTTTLTIVDLAGAEREKKTGNQGARLLESNFINNTSMVFGQCLRSLLEHQRHRNKTLQKHYKNSLLTRYLRDYLEGKKRMMLILTVKPGVEDYLDTSFLLRQASPFAKIKFKTVEEPVNLTNKRPNQALPQAGQLKKMKLGNNAISLIDEGKIGRFSPQNLPKEISGDAIEGYLYQNVHIMNEENVNEIDVISNGFSELGIQEKILRKGDSKLKSKKDREYRFMQGLSKALWSVLKQYKQKLEEIEIENCHLKNSLANAKTRSLDLENDLTNKNMRILDLENEVKELKSRYTCCSKPYSNVFRESTTHSPNCDLSQCQMAETPKVSDIVSPSLIGLVRTKNEKVADPPVNDTAAIFVSCSDEGDEQQQQKLEGIFESRDDTENTKGFRDARGVDMCSNVKVLPASNDSSRDLICCEDMGIVDIPSPSVAAIQLTCRSLYVGHNSEEEAQTIVGDEKNLESVSECALGESCVVDSLEFESNRNTRDYEDLNTAEQELSLFISHNCEQEAVTILGDVKNLESDCECAQSGSCVLDSLECEINKKTQDNEDLSNDKQELSHFISHSCEQDTLTIVGDVKNLESESECAPAGSCVVGSLECESNRNTQDYEDPNNAEQELSQLQSGMTDNSTSLVERQMAARSHADLKHSESLLNGNTCTHSNFPDEITSLVEEQNFPMSAHSHADLKSSESLRNGDTCIHVKDEESTQLEPPSTLLSKEGSDAQNLPNVPKVGSCNNQLMKKPRRRLQPASSILLKDLSLLNINDENVKPKGANAGKRAITDEKSRTQGSISLLNLLTSKLDR